MLAVWESRPGWRRAVVVLAGVLSLLSVTACARRAPATTRGATPTAPPFESGLASWYGKKFQGRTTASGERFDMHDLSAAHRSLRFGTVVRVVHRESGRAVEVRINDRGPFVDGRVIDLSYEAARRLGIVEEGVAPVSLYLVE